MDVYSSAQFYCVFREVVGVNATSNSPFIRNNAFTQPDIYINIREEKGYNRKKKKSE